MPRISRVTTAALALIATPVAASLLAPAATAATVSAGAPFVTRAADADDTEANLTGCTMNATGTNAAGETLILTAGHCAQTVGDQVYLTTTDGPVLVGETVYTTGAPYLVDAEDGRVNWDGDDYAVIKAYDTDSNGEPVVATARAATTNYASMIVDTPNQVGGVTSTPTSDPYIGQLVWADGASTGHLPGIVISDGSASDGRYFEVLTPVIPGDSGGAIYDMHTGETIGISSRDKIIGEDTPDSSRSPVSPRVTVHSNADAVANYEADNDEQFTYTEDTTAVHDNLRHPQGDDFDQAVTEVTESFDEAIGDVMGSLQ